MSALFPFLIPLALIATIVVVLMGVFTMARGGEFSRKYGNKLMRLRIALQAVTLVLVIAALWSLSGKS